MHHQPSAISHQPSATSQVLHLLPEHTLPVPRTVQRSPVVCVAVNRYRTHIPILQLIAKCCGGGGGWWVPLPPCIQYRLRSVTSRYRTVVCSARSVVGMHAGKKATHTLLHRYTIMLRAARFSLSLLLLVWCNYCSHCCLSLLLSLLSAITSTF